jgi:nicotinamide mononucleotide transporter
MSRVDRLVWSVLGVGSVGLLGNFVFNRATYGWVEMWGFITGAVCVWLAVKEHTWNFPVGLVNSGLFIWLFLDFKLYADVAINVVFVLLGLYGWYNWKFGGKNKSVLPVRSATLPEIGFGTVSVLLLTLFLQPFLAHIHDIAPWRDAFTFALSIVAQYFLDRKVYANWAFWIVADIVYIPLYFQKSLVLTGFVYCFFLAFCFRAAHEWRGPRNKHELISLMANWDRRKPVPETIR